MCVLLSGRKHSQNVCECVHVSLCGCYNVCHKCRGKVTHCNHLLVRILRDNSIAIQGN